MESLSLTDTPPPGPTLGLGLPPQQQPQLPPQMFTTAAQLLDLTDKKLMVSLRDGRKLIGVLRSWDQFANLVLQSTTERIFIPPSSAPATATASSSSSSSYPSPGLYADIPRGVFLVRGENVLLLGEIDLDRDDDIPPGYEKGDVDMVHALAKKLDGERRGREKRKVERLRGEGFEGEAVGEVLL